MNVLITGITGSGGSYLAEYILENHPEWEVWGTSRWHSTSVLNNIKDIKDRITVKECDLNDLSSVIRLLEECRPLKIFHMAATANVAVAFKTPLAILQNNIFGTANLLEAVRMVCPGCIFQQCSTSEVCGSALTVPITEDHPLNPCNPYAVSKLTAEKLAYSYNICWKIPVVISRAFCYINPRRHDLFATSFGLQIARIEQGKQKVLKHGNLKSIRTIIDVREICETYWIASDKCDYATPYNIGGITPISVEEVLNILKSKSKINIESEQDISLLRASDITNQVPDISKFCTKTGWVQKISIDKSLEWLLDNCREVVKNELHIML